MYIVISITFEYFATWFYIDVTYTECEQGSAKMVREVTGYEGFLSSARFIDDDNIITGSGQARETLFTLYYWQTCQVKTLRYVGGNTN